MSLFSSLVLLVRVSRVAAWCFGPILYTIGVLHSRDIPKAPAALLRYCIQVASLSFPLCIGEQDIRFICFARTEGLILSQSCSGSMMSMTTIPMCATQEKLPALLREVYSILCIIVLSYAQRFCRLPSSYSAPYRH